MKRHFPTAHFLLSSLCWRQKPHRCALSPSRQSLPGASLQQTTMGSQASHMLGAGVGPAEFLTPLRG